MEHWTEIRSALAVAKLGTVSAAAESLGVHRATINRHIDTVESHLGLPLFQRHAKGYTLTDTGRDMMEVAMRADELFTDFIGRASGVTEKLSGSLKISTLAEVSPLIIPIIDKFHLKHPNINLELIADDQLARLEHGEAHVAIRAGAKPITPDYVVLPFKKIRFGLYASKSYVKKNGLPIESNFSEHEFVGMRDINSPLPYTDWMITEVPEGSFALQTTNQYVITTAVKQGLGLGFVPEHESVKPALEEIIPPNDKWSVNLWLVTHVDLRRTLKVQEFLSITRAGA